MWRVNIIIFLLSPFLQAWAQEQTGMESIRLILGASSDEEIDAYEAERLEEFLTRPLKINFESFADILSSGLLTQYQTAALMDYRKNSGDILSYSELASVNGFDSKTVRILAPFISLESSAVPGRSSDEYRSTGHDLALKSGCKLESSAASRWNWGMKYRMEPARGLGGSLSMSNTYDEGGFRPDLVAGNLVFKFRRRTSKLILGDFNARFGQGLTLWNGMSLSGLASLSSFSRRGSGISESWSFTGTSSLTGIASSMSAGRFMISALAAFPGIKALPDKKRLSVVPAMNVAWYGKHLQFSLSEYMEFSGIQTDNPRIPHMKTSADVRCCIKGTDVFSEFAYDWVNAAPAFVFGSEFQAAEPMRMAALLRYYPASFDSSMSAAPRSGSKCSNELGFSLAGEMTAGDYVSINGAEGFDSSVKRHQCAFSLDALVHPESKSEIYRRTGQAKVILSWQYMITDALRLSARLNERVRNWESERFKTDFRMDLTYFSKRFTIASRVNLMKYVRTGFLSYIESGYKGDTFNMYFRQGVFFIDDWDDRIYAYERDAPGNFTVPSYYGRGIWTAFNSSWRFSKWGKLYFRAAVTSYPFMKEKKPGKAELKLQLSVSL